MIFTRKELNLVYWLTDKDIYDEDDFEEDELLEIEKIRRKIQEYLKNE